VKKYNRINLFFVLIGYSINLFSDSESNYAIVVGEEDKDRLCVVNEIYNPYNNTLFDRYINTGDQVLDIACGISIVTQKLADFVGETGLVVAIDKSPEQLAIAKTMLKEQKNIDFRLLSAYNLSVLEEKFDVIYVRFLLCHVPDPITIVKQAKSLLKYGGRLIIEDLTGNHTFFSVPHCQGMETLQYFDKLQFEFQQSDDKYFNYLSNLLISEGFEIVHNTRSHPELNTPRLRMMLTYNLSSLKDALISAQKITQQEYDEMYKSVQSLEKDLSVKVYSYELGQICATISN